MSHNSFLTEDLLLTIIINNQLSLSDIKSLCTSNKTIFNICKNNIKFIFKKLVEFYDLRIHNDVKSDYELLKDYFEILKSGLNSGLKLIDNKYYNFIKQFIFDYILPLENYNYRGLNRSLIKNYIHNLIVFYNTKDLSLYNYDNKMVDILNVLHRIMDDSDPRSSDVRRYFNNLVDDMSILRTNYRNEKKMMGKKIDEYIIQKTLMFKKNTNEYKNKFSLKI
jgi:hypothetical protein